MCGEALPEDKDEQEAIFQSIKDHGFGLFMPDGVQYQGTGPMTVPSLKRFVPIQSLQRKSPNKLLVGVKRFARSFGLMRGPLP